MTAPRQATIARNATIDVLRGVAILAVLVLHFALAYGLKDSPLGALPVWLLRGISWNGNYGVTMFFAVSGFLITTRSLRRWGTLQAIDLPRFYRLRVARIAPPLLLALGIIVVLGSLGVPWFDNVDDGHRLPASYFVIAVFSILTFWHNQLILASGWFNYCLNVYWSLSVEEVFYLALPLIARWLRRTGGLVAVGLALIVAGPVYRSIHPDAEIAYLASFDAIAMGVLAALLADHARWTEAAARMLRIGCGAALSVVYLLGIRDHETFGYSLIALASAGLMFGAAHAPAARWAASRVATPLRWMGRHSYELYLFHIIVLAFARNLVAKDALSHAARLPWLSLYLGLSALVAACIARFVSEPANRALRANASVSARVPSEPPPDDPIALSPRS